MPVIINMNMRRVLNFETNAFAFASSIYRHVTDGRYSFQFVCIYSSISADHRKRVTS